MSTKKELINKLKLKSLNDLTEKQLKYLYKLHLKEEKQRKLLENTNKKVDPNSKKYKIFLEFINNILENLDKDPIERLEDFKNIDREHIIEQSEVYDEMEKRLFKYFPKEECGWYRRNKVNHYILTFMKKACDIMGYKIIRKQTSIVEKDKYNGKLITTTHMFLFIV